jgi:hypothetical protein
MKVKEYFLSGDYEPIRKIRSNPSVVKNGYRTTMGKRRRSSTSDLDRVNDLTDSPRGVGCPTKDSAKTPTPHSKLTTRQSVRDAIKMRELLPRHIINDLNHED